MKWLTEKRRAWTYNVLLAAAPVVLYYGLASKEEIAVWMFFFQTILGIGLARVNVTTKE
jgi:hypothetical protein